MEDDHIDRVLDGMVDQVLAYKPPTERKQRGRKGKIKNGKTVSKTSSKMGASRTKK